MPAQPSPARWEDSEAVLGTWSVPQHSPARCHLPLLSLLVTLLQPRGCSHTQPCPWHRCPCPCLALLTVTPLPGVLPPPLCHHPATPPPGSPRLRGGSGAAPGSAQPCLPHLAGQRRRCSAAPAAQSVPCWSGAAPRCGRRWRGRWDPALPEGLGTATEPLRCPLPRRSLCALFFGWFYPPQGVPRKVEVPLGDHALCRAVPAAGRRACCSDSGPGDTECLVLLGNVPAAARHQVNTGDR